MALGSFYQGRMGDDRRWLEREGKESGFLFLFWWRLFLIFSTWAGIFLVGVGFGWIGLAWLLGGEAVPT